MLVNYKLLFYRLNYNMPIQFIDFYKTGTYNIFECPSNVIKHFLLFIILSSYKLFFIYLYMIELIFLLVIWLINVKLISRYLTLIS